MIKTAMSHEGAFSAPHREAAYVGRTVLDAGGTAMEAMVAAAAMIAVTYPHMNGIGGDGFWLIHRPGQEPVGISACGQAAKLATPDRYTALGFTDSLPTRGANAAITVPGTIGGWQRALATVENRDALPLAELLGPAIRKARDGITVTGSQAHYTREKLPELLNVPGFAEVYLQDGHLPKAGARQQFPGLARTLEALVTDGLESFYTGAIAERNAAYLEAQGSPLRLEDFHAYSAETVTPLHLETKGDKLFNMIPPTQGVASLMILGIFDRLNVTQGDSFAHVHGLVEATKQAFIRRNRELGDPSRMVTPAQQWLDTDNLDALASNVDMSHALPWPYEPAEGDTIWMGAADKYGNVVSFIQSIYWEFGSGLVCPETGVLFQNRGAGFSLAAGHNQIGPGRRPFHTLNPALAQLSDGRVMAYGTMGGEGQPQTQSAVFTRYHRFNMGLQEAVTAPRWLLGRTWGENSTNLKLESRFDGALVSALEKAGHDLEVIAPFSDLCGHAGAVVRHPDGLCEAAADPRSDGFAI